MCTVSMIFDAGRQLPDGAWTKDALSDFKRVVDAAKVFDKATGQADCEDPEKAAFLKRITARVAAREMAAELKLMGVEADAFVLGAEWATK